jgi:hypothetical protein
VRHPPAAATSQPQQLSRKVRHCCGTESVSFGGRQKGYGHDIWNSKCEDSIFIIQIKSIIGQPTKPRSGTRPKLGSQINKNYLNVPIANRCKIVIKHKNVYNIK